LYFILEPKISIITITYNSEATLEDTILSVTAQDYPALEYVIIDGGSTDGTLDIIRKYQNRIQVVVSEPDHGISDAFNKGITRATGEIVGIINSDDILLPGALQRVADMYDSQVDVYSGLILFWDMKTNDTFPSYPDVTFDTLKLQYNVAHPARFIRKDAYERYGLYREDLRYMMDIELLCRFYKQGANFLLIDSPLAKFRIGGTTNDSIYKKKEDYRAFVQSFGGSAWDFRRIWMQAVIKYNLIQLGYWLFGKNLKFKIQHNAILKRLIPL
jgi:glycosyltransferase involved in cell wall biosynthesis